MEIAPVALLPFFVFWGLDGYLLWKERQFRDFYDNWASSDYGDLSMDPRSHGKFRKRSWLGATFSRIFYPAMAAVVIVLRMARD